MRRMIFGIDLGTTNSLVARMTADGPQLVPNALGDVLTPSVVGIDLDGQVLVGRAARELMVTHPDRGAARFKRHMGSDWVGTVAGREFGAVELSGLVLGSLKRDAEAAVGKPVSDAVITVPAYFNEHQRQATMRAGRLAGWNVLRILNEPTAAAIAYGVHDSAEDKVFMVFDLGGGTFDVSIMDRFEGALEIRASAGEIFLGGEDFTDSMAARLLEGRGIVFERAELETPLMVSRLRRECEQAKRTLSREPKAAVRIPDRDGAFPAGTPAAEVTREQFEAWTETILARTWGPLRRAMGDARLQRADIGDVILVGGATRMPGVRAKLAAWFGREPRCGLNPDEVVALGAAVQGGLLARDVSLKDVVVTDVAPFTLGVETCHTVGGQERDGYFLPIINRNTTIPVSRVKRVATMYPNQTAVKVRLFQGESRRVEGNVFLGEFSVDGIPRGPAGEEIDIRFTYDLNGVLEVEATVVKTRRTIQHVVTRFTRGLNEAQVAAALEAMRSLKSHPRDETVNRMLLRRAERVFQELSVDERTQLEMILSGFEEALELEDKSSIEAHREMLSRFLDAVDGSEEENQSWS